MVESLAASSEAVKVKKLVSGSLTEQVGKEKVRKRLR
jgi:hypothetical protein